MMLLSQSCMRTLSDEHLSLFVDDTPAITGCNAVDGSPQIKRPSSMGCDHASYKPITDQYPISKLHHGHKTLLPKPLSCQALLTLASRVPPSLLLSNLWSLEAVSVPLEVYLFILQKLLPSAQRLIPSLSSPHPQSQTPSLPHPLYRSLR
jgi:hypothetical protein